MIFGNIILCAVGSVIMAEIFEMFYHHITQHQTSRISKKDLCKLYYSVLILVGFVSGGPQFVILCLPSLAIVALSHHSLCGTTKSRIMWQQVVKNIVPAAKQVLHKLG
jgi:hypothetical protein